MKAERKKTASTENEKKKTKQREKISHELLRRATHFVIVKSDTNGTHSRLTRMRDI